MKFLRDSLITFFRHMLVKSRCRGRSGAGRKSKPPLNLSFAKEETNRTFAIPAPAALLLVSFLFASLFAAEPPVRSNAWQQTDCSVFQIKTEGRDVECGFITVPRRHAEPSGPAIRLAAVTIKADGDKRAPAPLYDGN